MIYPRYKGRLLIPSNAAMREMTRYGIMLDECLLILKEGYPAPRKRARKTKEIWFDRGNKTYNIVIVELFNNLFKEEIYLITHIGEFTRK